MSLKLPTLVAFDLSMTLSQTTHVAASASLLGTSEGVAEYRAPQCGQNCDPANIDAKQDGHMTDFSDDAQ